MNTAPQSTRRAPPPLGLGSAAIGVEEQAAALEVLRSGDLFRYYGDDPGGPPPAVAALEAGLREWTGLPYAHAVTSGTAALECVIAAMGIGPGAEVIVPAWSWISCFTAIVRSGARPVLAEVDESLMIDADEFVRLASPRTRAVLVVQYQGVGADMQRIVHEAHRRGWWVIEDCAESPGAEYKGRLTGTWGDAAIYSFQHNKPMTAGEGGAIVTRDARIYERAVRMSDLGQYRAIHAAMKPAESEAFSGGQYRMSELTAAVALAQLRKVPAIRDHCRMLAARIVPRLAVLPGISLRHEPDPTGAFPFELYFFARSPEVALEYSKQLEACGVNCTRRTGTYPQYHRDYVKNGAAVNSALSPFRDMKPWPAPGYRAEDFPRTENLTQRFVALPLGWKYTVEDADHIARSVEEAHASIEGS